MDRESTLRANLKHLEDRIDQALTANLRNRKGLTMVAVSKRQPLFMVHTAYALGLRHFGENQVQEGIPKVKAAEDDITWHFIGHLQKNKVRKAVKHFHYIHSIDSLGLLERVNEIADEERVCPSILLQVNYSLDPDKQGLHPDAVTFVLEAALAMKNIVCVGLMGIPPLQATAAKVEAYYKGLAEMRNELKETFPDWPGKLSMGMSGDLEAAIAAGSNFIRVGTSLFGERD